MQPHEASPCLKTRLAIAPLRRRHASRLPQTNSLPLPSCPVPPLRHCRIVKAGSPALPPSLPSPLSVPSQPRKEAVVAAPLLLTGRTHLISPFYTTSRRHYLPLSNHGKWTRLVSRFELFKGYDFFRTDSASASLSTSAKPAARSAMPAGSCTAWSTGSSQTARCPRTRPSEGATTVSTPSSPRRGPANTSPGPSSSI